jgi:hypothetical protein
MLQPCDVTDTKRFASVSIPIYFILAQFTWNRIRDSHTICFGYLKIDPLNFPKRLDCNEGGFLICDIYCPTVMLDELFLSARAVYVLWWCFIARFCSSPNDWLFKTSQFFIIKRTRCTSFPNLLRRETLHVSGSSSAHHQEFIHCTLGTGICHTGLKTAFGQDHPGPVWKLECFIYCP